MNPLSNDLRTALRQYRTQPAFVLTIVSTLALTIGGTVAVFSLVNGVLLRALPFSTPHELVWIASVRPDNPSAPFSLPEFLDYRSHNQTLAGLAAYANWSASITDDSGTERLQGARLSANAFELLGMSAAAGRLLRSTDDDAAAPRAAVLSHRLWQQKFGGSVDVIGSAARINGEGYVIVGVMPAQFPLPLRDVDVVVPLAPERDPQRHVRSSVNFLRLFGRLGPHRTSSDAQADLSDICRRLREQFPVEYARKDAVRVFALHEAIVGDYRRSMFMLLAAVVVVLCTALANLVSLVLVRVNERRPELAIRIAVGASQGRLARQLSAEALVLAVAGSGAGVALAAWTVAQAPAWIPPSIPRLGELRIDSAVVFVAVSLAAITTVVFAVAPLGAITPTRASGVLRSATRGGIGDKWNQRVRHLLVAAEISAAFTLLVAASSLLQNLAAVQNLHPGFIPDSVFQARVSLPPTYRSTGDISRFYDTLSTRLLALPGVRHVGLISIAPLSGLLATISFSIPDAPALSERDVPSASLRVITPAYLSAVGTRLLHGRGFTETDREDTPAVALVNQTLAARLLAGEAVGRPLRIDDNSRGARPVQIVGVIEDVRHDAMDIAPAFDIYIPLRQIHPEGVPLLRNNHFWMVKTASDPAALRNVLVNELRAVDRDVAIASAGPMRQYLEASLGPRRFNLGLLGGFALTAVLLAVSGVYGLVSYSVSKRSAEIGLRMAIGAREWDVHRLILRQAMTLGVSGTLLGLGAVGLGRAAVARVWPELRTDPATVMSMAALLLSLVAVAAWIPARRAARVAPTLALKAD